jgi:hypothetical protein
MARKLLGTKEKWPISRGTAEYALQRRSRCE